MRSHWNADRAIGFMAGFYMTLSMAGTFMTGSPVPALTGMVYMAFSVFIPLRWPAKPTP